MPIHDALQQADTSESCRGETQGLRGSRLEVDAVEHVVEAMEAKCIRLAGGSEDVPTLLE